MFAEVCLAAESQDANHHHRRALQKVKSAVVLASKPKNVAGTLNANSYLEAAKRNAFHVMLA